MRVRLICNTSPVPRDRGKPRALAISLALHIASFLGLMYAPPLSLPSLPPPSPTEYQQGFAGKEDRIIWYKFRKLPDIAPKSSPKARQALRAAVKADQAIISSTKNAPQRTQVVLAPVPAIEDMPPLDLPNMIAVKLPPRQFTTPPDLVRPEAARIETPIETPDAPAQQLESTSLPADRLPGRPFMPPPAAPGPPPARAKIVAPSDAPEYVEQSPLSAGLPAIRLPSRPFVPPTPQKAPDPRGIAAATEVPVLSPDAPPASAALPVKLPARAFAPPPVAPAKSAKNVAVPLVETPAGDLTMAIAGLNPATTPVKLPAASSPAQFSAGQTVRPDGATADGAGKGITVPDLYAHAPDGGKDAKPDLLALTYAAPTSKEFLDDVMRHRQPAASPAKNTPDAQVPGGVATRVSNAPDRRFNGRDVYLMAIQLSNLTSYSGHWLLWYAARSMDHTELDAMTAPVPRRKVDPKYTPSAMADHVEGRVQLFCVIGREGTVSSIELLRGADERLNASAEEALSKWEFYPATRNGQPVDVDVVVEIPFVLPPPPLK
jgi:TonB family protein